MFPLKNLARKKLREESKEQSWEPGACIPYKNTLGAFIRFKATLNMSRNGQMTLKARVRRSKSMTPIFNISGEYPIMHVCGKICDFSWSMGGVIAQAR